MIPIEQRFIPFNLFLFFGIRLASLRLANLMITFLGHCFSARDNPHCLKGQLPRLTYQKFWWYSRLSLLTLSGTPVISKHSRLEYWLFPQHCLSNATTCSCRLLFTFLRQVTLIHFFWNRCEVRLVLCWYWIKCYQILLDILKSVWSLNPLLVFLKQP